MPSLSPSSLNLFKECPRCFWLQLREGVKRPDSIFPSLPSGMDRVLKAHFDSFRDKGELPPELSKLKGYALFDDPALLEVWRNNRKGITWTDSKGNVLRGAVDNLLKKGDKLVVLDYKTRGFPLKEDTAAHYQDQLNIYNFLLQKNGYKTEDYAYLLFYHPSRVLASGEVVFHTDLVKMEVDVDNAEKLFRKGLKALEGSIPDASKECGFCGWAVNYPGVVKEASR